MEYVFVTIYSTLFQLSIFYKIQPYNPVRVSPCGLQMTINSIILVGAETDKPKFDCLSKIIWKDAFIFIYKMVKR